MITLLEDLAKETLFKIDYDLAKEIDELDEWEDSVIFKDLFEALIKASEMGMNG